MNRLDASKCAKCGTKVFPVFKLQTADRRGPARARSTLRPAPSQLPRLTVARRPRSVWHVDCFRCATCNCQLSASAYAAGPEGEPVCLKHASKDARLSSLA